MRWTKTLIPTLKEDPSDAEIISHKLMFRAGLIRQLAAGAYTYLPLGFRALNKATRIVRDEMDRAGAIEILMPALQPVELWRESGRYETYGDDLMKLVDRRGRRLALGPTHEEVVTDIARKHISSYRQLPITLYQIQTKFRDEPRPRFGVLRTCEFLMKDAYSFGTSLEQLSESYDAMYAAYRRIFDRCGLTYVAVEAESGPIGGDVSAEFIAPSENGEDQLVQCDNSACGYAANRERAEIGERGDTRSAAGQRGDPGTQGAAEAMRTVDTPGAKTIEQVSKMLRCRPEQMIKTLVYLADGKPLAVLVRGDHEVNEAKLRRALGAREVALADPATIERVTGAPVGFAGPVGLKLDVVADRHAAKIRDGVTGANQADRHFVGVQPGRDFPIGRTADVRFAVDDDPCPRCSGTLRIRRGIEIGHVFKLGTRYSDPMKAHFEDAGEERKPLIMGCYGLGINRVVAAMIETSHDADGIIWSPALAPYDVLLVPLNVQNADVTATSDRLYEQLSAAGVDVLYDDRDARPGFKFKDADLIGIPLRVVVGERGLKEGKIELKRRTEKQPRQVALEGAFEAVLSEVQKHKAGTA